MEDEGMPQKKHKPEEIVAKLRQVDVLVSQGRSVADPLEERHVQLALQSLDLPAHSGLSQFQHPRRSRETAGLGGGEKGPRAGPVEAQHVPVHAYMHKRNANSVNSSCACEGV